MKERFETFTVLINRIGRNIRKIKNREMAEHNLRSSHISCLYHLYSSDALIATELCERCEEDKATISRAIEYLEANGYLIRESKSAKRYKSPLILTEKGNNIGKSIAEKVKNVLKEVGAGLSEEERIVFYRCLTVISNNLVSLAEKSKSDDNF